MDKNRVKKVMTFKSGQFVFSSLYDKPKMDIMLKEAQILYATIAELPILPDLASQLEEELIIKSIFGTAAIEGNPLSEGEVKTLLTEEKKNKSLRRVEREIENLKRVYKIIKDTKRDPSKPFILTEELIKTVQKRITTGIPYKGNEPGVYRNQPVFVGNKEHGGVYTPPKILEDIKNLMQEFILWINSEEVLQEDPAIRAALIHYYLGLIHPFGDGNGRTARVMEAILLKSAGIKFVPPMLSNFYYQNIDDYYWAFSLARKNKERQITPFLEFFLQGLVKSLENIKERVANMIIGVMLKVYYENLKKGREITQRQYELSRVLLSYPKIYFKLNDLFTEPVFQILYHRVTQRTARRDLQRMVAKGLLELENKQFCLNWRLLD